MAQMKYGRYMQLSTENYLNQNRSSAGIDLETFTE